MKKLFVLLALVCGTAVYANQNVRFDLGEFDAEDALNVGTGTNACAVEAIVLADCNGRPSVAPGCAISCQPTKNAVCEQGSIDRMCTANSARCYCAN